MDNLQLAFWQFDNSLHPDFQRGLEVFYSRIDSVVNNGRGLLVDSDVDRLLQKAADIPEIEFLAVMAVGTLFSNQSKITESFRQAIAEMKQDFLVMGHLIDKKARYCGLHEQAFIVNMKTYRKMQRPHFGNYHSGTQILRNYSAGPSIHDDYTPRFVKPLPGETFYDADQCGWNFVHASLKAGMQVLNLPDSLRQEKLYCYPDDHSAKLRKNLELLYQMEDLENFSQRQALGFLINRRLGLNPQTHGSPVQLAKRPMSVYLMNSEYLVPDLDWVKSNRTPLDHFTGPASGFLDAAALHSHGFHSQTRLTYFDINPRSLYYKQRMLEEFDGRFKSLKPLFDQFKAEDPEQIFVIVDFDRAIENILRVFGSEIEFRKCWQAVRPLKKEFLTVNLLTASEQLFARIQPSETALLAFSDIFTAQNELTYGWSRLHEKYQSFVRRAEEFPGLILSGHDTESRLYIRKTKIPPQPPNNEVSF